MMTGFLIIPFGICPEFFGTDDGPVFPKDSSCFRCALKLYKCMQEQDRVDQ